MTFATGTQLAPPLVAEVRRLLLEHLQQHYALYGDYSGVRTARKHIGWYVRDLPGGEQFRSEMNAIEDCDALWRAVAEFFDVLAAKMDRIPPDEGGNARTPSDEQADALAS